jgi:phage tail sheath protein FI
MPEYLSPGVFIEEIPARLKAIEGVSTSTGGFVGAAERGTVAGFPLPYVPLPADRIALPRDPAPVLITSFADFVRQFGTPFADPATAGYLGHSIRAFFDNGGKRCFVARVTTAGAARANLQVHQGAIMRLVRRATTGQDRLFVNTVRDVTTVAADNNIRVYRLSDGAQVGAMLNVIDYDVRENSIRLGAALGAGVTFEPDEVYIRSRPVPPATAPGPAPLNATGPVFFARSPGAWGGRLRVTISSADRPPTPIVGAPVINAPQITVDSAASFYRGAIIEIDHGAPKLQSYHEVLDIQPGNILQIQPVLPAAATAAGFVRVVEIDVTIEDLVSRLTESFSGLTWNLRNDTEIRRRHYSTAINTRSRLVYVQPPSIGGLGGAENPTIANQPITDRGRPVVPTGGNVGSDGVLGTPSDLEIIGVDAGPGQRTGVQSLQDADDIRIIAAPGRTATAVQNELITQCERMRYRFAVLDAERDPNPSGVVTAVLSHRNAYDTSFASYYTPWVEIAVGDDRIALPPSGYVIGIYARVDNERGVHKAPANEVVRGVVGLNAYITTGEQDVLNPRGVNAIRRFEGRGIRVWGARTLSSDPEFRYTNVRRFLIFLEASLDRGTQWVVFEPNAPETWSRVVDSVSAFLFTQWRDGALFGRRPEDAFFVRCDETTMSVDDVQNGRLICNIGVAIVRPAEFVIFRIEQITGFARQS